MNWLPFGELGDMIFVNSVLTCVNSSISSYTVIKVRFVGYSAHNAGTIRQCPYSLRNSLWLYINGAMVPQGIFTGSEIGKKHESLWSAELWRAMPLSWGRQIAGILPNVACQTRGY
jgi:hypothetical protein